MFSRCIHAVAKGNIFFFFFIAKKYFIVYMSHICFIHLSTDGHVNCFHIFHILVIASQLEKDK